MDYIVDEACASLRSISNTFKPSSKPETSLQKNKKKKLVRNFVSASTHLIVDLVFTTIGGDLDSIASSSTGSVDVAPMYLLKDMIFDTLENIDTLANSPIYQVTKTSTSNEKSQQLDAMLHVLQVFVHRTTAPPPLNLFPVTLRASQHFVLKIYGASGSMAKTFAKSVRDVNNVTIPEEPELEKDPEFEKLSIEDKIKYIANHRKESEAAMADDIDDDNESPPPVTPAHQLLLDILNRCTYFISVPSITCTVSIVETISAALLRLSTCQRLLLPALHQIFPALMNRMSEAVQTLHDTAPKTLTRSSDKSLLIESKTRYFNKSADSAANSVASSNSNSNTVTISTVEQSKDPLRTAEKLHLLPALCEMFNLMSLLAGDFLTLKYREELFPQVIGVLKFYHSKAWESAQSNDAKSLKSASGLQFCDLLLSGQSQEKVAETQERSVENNPNEAEAVSVYNRFSVHSKIKKSVLGLISQMCASPVCARMLSDHGIAFAWFVLPLLFSREVGRLSFTLILVLGFVQSNEVVELATAAFLALAGVQRDIPLQLVEGMLYSFKKPSSALASISVVSYDGAIKSWRSVTQHRQIVQCYESRDRQGAVRSLVEVPRAEELLKLFHSDATFMDRVNGIYLKLK